MSGYTHYNFEKTGPNTHTIARLGFVAASKAFSLQGSVSHGEFVHQDVVEAQPPPRRGLKRSLLWDGGGDGRRAGGRSAEREEERE